MKQIKSIISRNFYNSIGWRTNRKIIVFESDDWGSIRTPSKDAYDICLKNGYPVDRHIFSKYDSLASEEDIELLFQLLLNFKDRNNNHPVITANCLVANPDFEKIRKHNFKEYFFEPITETFKRYPQHSKCFELWQKGIREKIFSPQSHGREHLNVTRFMGELKTGDKDALFAFDLNMPGIISKNNFPLGNKKIITLEHKDEADKKQKMVMVGEGLDLFEKLFGFRSLCFTPANYVWTPDYESMLDSKGVKFFQGSKIQLIPKGEYKGFKKKYHYLGQKNRFDQIFLVRNVTFEPTFKKEFDWVSSALSEIGNAFFWQKPAIICMHRINFVGYLVPENRDRTLKLLKQLLIQILKKWPEVEFMSSDQLGTLISREEKNAK